MTTRRDGRGLMAAWEVHKLVERLQGWKDVTRAEEIEMARYGVVGPIGPREECYAVQTGHNTIYFDGSDNELEPLWVLEQIRGTDQPRSLTEEEAKSHPWMQERGTA